LTLCFVKKYSLFFEEYAFYNYYNILSKGGPSMKTIDTLTLQLERVNALAEVLYGLLHDNHQAQILAEIIIETSASSSTRSAA